MNNEKEFRRKIREILDEVFDEVYQSCGLRTSDGKVGDIVDEIIVAYDDGNRGDVTE